MSETMNVGATCDDVAKSSASTTKEKREGIRTASAPRSDTVKRVTVYLNRDNHLQVDLCREDGGSRSSSACRDGPVGSDENTEFVTSHLAFLAVVRVTLVFGTDPELVNLHTVSEYERDRVLQGPLGTRLGQQTDHPTRRGLTRTRSRWGYYWTNS
jgi:hypothetical protein